MTQVLKIDIIKSKTQYMSQFMSSKLNPPMKLNKELKLIYYRSIFDLN